MFGADFLANIIVWRWINNAIVHILGGVGFVLWIAVALAKQGAYVPLVIVAVIGILIGLVIWNAFRRQRRLQEWRNAPIDMGKQEPHLHVPPVAPHTGLRAAPSNRWPVAR